MGVRSKVAVSKLPQRVPHGICVCVCVGGVCVFVCVCGVGGCVNFHTLEFFCLYLFSYSTVLLFRVQFVQNGWLF